MKKHVSFRCLKLAAVFQNVLRRLLPLRSALEELWQSLQAHALSYQSHVKVLRYGTSGKEVRFLK